MLASTGGVYEREKAARVAIKRAFGTDGDEYGVTLFVSHHLDEIEGSYWQKHLNYPHPQPASVLDLLVLQPQMDDEEGDGLEILDFTLPGNATDYVLSVRFDDSGQVEEISMES